MVLYRDSGGVPSGRWAQSGIITIPAGTSGSWVNFTGPATALDPGQYWIVIHTGNISGTLRSHGDGSPNFYNNVDAFADGPSNPFGTGTTGTVTLSVNARYTVGY